MLTELDKVRLDRAITAGIRNAARRERRNRWIGVNSTQTVENKGVPVNSSGPYALKPSGPRPHKPVFPDPIFLKAD